MGLVFNNAKNPTQLVITTHSPYVLTSINNLVQGHISESKLDDTRKNELYNILPKEYLIDEHFLNAFAFKDGKVESIINKELGLIYSRYLDNISEEIAIQFDQLLEF
ncbi:MAG: hypothetical protein J0I84_21335, partial [Terrimonas sp.]|nr:hypothetical protein [Terrimonas sp.]